MLRPLALTLLALALPLAAPAADDAAAAAPDAAKKDIELTEALKGWHESKPAAKKADYFQKELVGKACTFSAAITAYKQVAYHRSGQKADDAMIVLKAGRDEIYLKPEDDITDPKKLPYPVHDTLSGSCRIIGLSDDGHPIVEQADRLTARSSH